jgi:outer membrane protein OmpA-like peptidoglycan-associated protein
MPPCIKAQPAFPIGGHDMRRGIVSLAIACVVGVGTLGYGQIATSTRDDAQDWRHQELAFLTSVHKRIQADLANGSGDRAAASLRREEHSILVAMAAVANPMSADRVSDDVKALPASNAPKEDALIGAASMERSGVPAALLPGGGSPAPPPAAGAPGWVPPEASPEAPSGPAVREVKASSRPPIPPLAMPAAGHTLPELEAALNAEKTDRGLRVVLPASALFGTARAALDPAADLLLSNLAQLMAAMLPREIVVIGPSGEDDANLSLSKERAHAVAAWLAAHGSGHRAHFVERVNDGAGSVAPNNADGAASPEEREQNYPIQILLRRH